MARRSRSVGASRSSTANFCPGSTGPGGSLNDWFGVPWEDPSTVSPSVVRFDAYTEFGSSRTMRGGST